MAAKEQLRLFFLWFRENGELYVNNSIEKMIDIYLKELAKVEPTATADFDKFKEYEEACAEVKRLKKKCLLLSGDAGKWAGEAATYKEKYDKCISVIKKFDSGIIGMYDL